MFKRFLLGLLLAGGYQVLAQYPVMEWYEGHGTNLEEHVHEGWQTSDRGFIGIGQNEESGGNRTNILVVKTDSAGIHEWTAQLGTMNEYDVGICVHETTGGYIIGGGLYNEETGRQDRALVKLDRNGGVLWERTYDGKKAGAVRGIDINKEGEIFATGYTNSAENGYVFIVDEGDGFIMKTDTTGDIIWDKPLSVPQGTKVRIEQDGSLAVISSLWVYSGGRDHMDAILIRTDDEGNEIFSGSYGGEYSEHCYDFDLTPDGGYILAGHTQSYGVVNWDYMLMKIDSAGNQEWVQTFGQPRGYDPRWIHDEAYGVRSTPDGGYVIAGGSGDEYSYSERGHPSGPSGEWKAYLVKTDGAGNLLWEAVYPPTPVGNNAAEYVALTDDGGYVVFTDTDSQAPPEPNNFGYMKIAPDTVSVSRYIELTLTVEGEGQVYPRNRYHVKDSVLTLTATPEDGWVFESWGGDLTGAENPLSVAPGKDISVQANFRSTAGSSGPQKELLSVYPNPVSAGDRLNILLPFPMEDALLLIYDIHGREIVSKQYTGNRHQIITEELGDTMDGLYMLRLSTIRQTLYSTFLVK